MNFLDPSGARPSSQIDDFPVAWFGTQDESPAARDAPVETARLLDFGFAPVDQGPVPCCVSVALTAAMQFIGPTPPLAPLFNYFLSRLHPDLLSDVEILDAFRSAMNRGVCVQSFHPVPFDLPSALIAPSTAALADALSQRLVPDAMGKPSFMRADVVADRWKEAIARSLPVLMGFFMSPEYDAIRQGMTRVHARPTALGNGHACLAIGYDDSREEFTIRDSRGTGVGAAGTWQLPYDRLEDHFIYESWVVVAVP